MKLAIKSGVVAAALFVAAQGAHAGEQLDGAAIKKLMSGAVATGTTSRGAPYLGKYGADGTIEGSVSDGKYTDTGKWEVRDGKFCRAWSNWRNGSEACFTVEDIGDNEYRFNEGGGQGSSTLKITKG